MKKYYKYALWLAVFIGIIYDFFEGNNNTFSLAIIGLWLLVLGVFGMKHFLKKDQWIFKALIWFLCVQAGLVLIEFTLVLLFDFGDGNFGLGLILGVQFAFVIVTAIFTGMYYLITPYMEHKNHMYYKELFFTSIILIFMATHLLVVPNGTYVPISTYFFSIGIFTILFLLIEFILYKVVHIHTEWILLVYSLLYIGVQLSPFPVQLLMLYSLEILIIGHLIFYLIKEYKLNNKKIQFSHDERG